MLRMTRQADYGIVLLTHFVTNPERRMQSARNLSEQSRLPLPMVTKILKILTRRGLLSSHRGAKGGYILAHPPERISVADIVRALEGPIALTECIVGTPGDCEHKTVCLVRNPLEKINLVIRQALEGVRLSDLAQPFSEQLVNVDDLRPVHQAVSS